ncbi:hypothetical protein JYU10_00060 [bacterium AH-315-J04]|nr:hypothetical protein [bacterium AH-315-J04]
MRGKGIRAWSPIVGGLAIGLCLFGLSIKGAPAGDEGSSSKPKGAGVTSIDSGAASLALRVEALAPAASGGAVTDNPTVGYLVTQPPAGNQFGDEDNLRVYRDVVSGPAATAAPRDGGAAAVGDFCNCDADCATPASACEVVICSADSSGGNEIDVGEQYTCRLINRANGARCDLDNLFCTADECDGAGACVVDPDADAEGPCRNRCDGASANANETCEKDSDCQGGACAGVATCDEANDVCNANGGEIGRCCAYDVNGDVDLAISGYLSSTACFIANGSSATGLTWRRAQDNINTFRCPKYSAGIADTFDGAGALISPAVGTEIGAVRRTANVCEFDLTPCEDAAINCLRVCVQSNGMLPSVQPQSCTGDAECLTLGDGTATCLAQACAPLECGQDASHTLCTGTEDMRCPGEFRIGDDYSVSNGSFIALRQFSYRGGVDHSNGVLVFDFWDNTGPARCTANGAACSFIGETCASGAGLCWGPNRVGAFAVAQNTGDTSAIRTITIDCAPSSNCFGDTDAPDDPEMRIPGTGYVTMRSTRGFQNKANGFWFSAGAPDVGTNDDTVAWRNGGPTTDDSLVAGSNNDGLAFELVGDKIADPLGACCGITQLVCSDGGLASDCVGLLAGAVCNAGTCGLVAGACDDVHRYECRTCQGGGPRLGQLCSATRECSPLGASESICTGTDWKGARFNATVPSLCASDVCNIGGCCTNGVCEDTTLALCVGPGTFLGGGSGCHAAVTRQQGGSTTPFTDPNHNCCPQPVPSFSACCEDTPYCSGDQSANMSCNSGNTGTDCGALFCENYRFDFVCSEVGGDGECGQGAIAGTPCGNAGTCGVPCAVDGADCSSTPYCSGVLGNPPCPLVCSDVAGDCTGSVVGASCATGTCGLAGLGTSCFGAGTCTQSTCVQPTCKFCTGPIVHSIDVLGGPTTVCENSGAVCDATNANFGICDCPQNAGICNFVCADGANVGDPCTLATEAAICGAGFTCGVQSALAVEDCVTGLPLQAVTVSGTRPFKDDPQTTGLVDVFDFDDGDLCTLNSTDPGLYEVFTINDFSRVTVDMCCKVPIMSNRYNVIFEACSCVGFDFILSNIGQGGDGNTGLFGAADNKADLRCETDNNISMTFDLPAGSYAYPIFSNRACSSVGGACDDVLDCPSGDTCAGQTERDYQFHVTVAKAQRAACCTGASCSVITKLECEGNDQLPTDNPFFPGGPNTVVVPGGNWLGSQGPEDAIVSTPVVDCAINVCLLGACCGGPGGTDSCVDVFGGGSPGDGINEGDCVTVSGGVGVYQGGIRCVDDPCPACQLDPNSECQVDFASISNSSDRHHEFRVADDFIPLASTIDRICWSGVWGGTEAGVNCNDDPPDDTWYVTIYEDDGNGIPDMNAIVFGPETPITHDGRKIIDLQAGFKPTSYSAPVSVTGLVVGDCYWIEIMGEGSGDLADESCGWNWFWTDTSGGGQGNQEPSQDGNGWSLQVAGGHPVPFSEANLQKNDYAWCSDGGIEKNTAGNEGNDGGCGDRTGTFACCYRDELGQPVCTSLVDLFKCILNPDDDGLAGTVFTGQVCDDNGGAFACSPPANDDCDTAATVLAPASCTPSVDIGNCAKAKASWCSPLFSACSGTDGLCIPIVDDGDVESTGQFDCAIQGTDNRFATTDGPPIQNNATVIDDCSGSDNGGGPFRADIWYKVTAPCTGKMSVTMCGGGVFDAMMATYTECPDGNDQSAPTLIECNDDACGTFATVSELPAFNVVVDQEVTIRVGGWSQNSAGTPGTDGEAGQGISQVHARFACFPSAIDPAVAATGEHGFSKDRYVSMDPSANGATEVAVQVTRAGSATSRYLDCTSLIDLGADGWIAQLIDGPLPGAGDSTYYCDLGGITQLHIRGCNVLPGNTYDVELSSDGAEFSAILGVDTTPPHTAASRSFGDVVGGLIAGAWTAPEGIVTANDIVAVIQKFSLNPTAAITARLDNDGAVPNGAVTGGDILRAVQGFAGNAFGFGVTGCLTGTCVPDPGCEP